MAICGPHILECPFEDPADVEEVVPESNVPDLAAYPHWKAQLEALGERDPLDVLDETPQILNWLLGQYRVEQLETRIIEHKWSPAEIMAHLLDVEWIFGYRVRTVLCDKEPRFGGVNQVDWMEGQRALRPPLPEIVHHFCTVRAANLTIWNTLSEDDLQRSGKHLTAGVTLTIGMMRSILAGHDLHHRAQIDVRLG